mmetsp:Transcript_79021/g.189795  ORF Transcript_79021/g.189795 Transcript_79021/m.189795 type:complete len:226 (-) Transcript_79021:1256-1933(-)
MQVLPPRGFVELWCPVVHPVVWISTLPWRHRRGNHDSDPEGQLLLSILRLVVCVRGCEVIDPISVEDEGQGADYCGERAAAQMDQGAQGRGDPQQSAGADAAIYRAPAKNPRPESRAGRWQSSWGRPWNHGLSVFHRHAHPSSRGLLVQRSAEPVGRSDSCCRLCDERLQEGGGCAFAGGAGLGTNRQVAGEGVEPKPMFPAQACGRGDEPQRSLQEEARGGDCA